MYFYRNNAYIVITFILIAFVLVSCSKDKTHFVTKGVYYWKTVLNLDVENVDWIKDNDIKKIYIRFFDVDWDPSTNQALPIGNLRIVSNKIPGIEIIPTVFITNKTFLNLPDSSINDLAAKSSCWPSCSAV